MEIVFFIFYLLALRLPAVLFFSSFLLFSMFVALSPNCAAGKQVGLPNCLPISPGSQKAYSHRRARIFALLSATVICLLD